MVRPIVVTAAHNVAGDETVCLIYQLAILKSKFPRTWLLCVASERTNEKGGPSETALLDQRRETGVQDNQSCDSRYWEWAAFAQAYPPLLPLAKLACALW